SAVDTVSMRVAEDDNITIEGTALQVIYTPGHTDDSYSFLMNDRVFTGDTLLIRGTGRTDFQNGDPIAQYDSLFNKLLRLPAETLVYPAHDYKGDTVSTIDEELRCNPRLQVTSADEYADIMHNLDLADPKLMDVAVPANLAIGLRQDDIDERGWSVSAADARALINRQDTVLVDLRDTTERSKQGVIPGSVHAPYPELGAHLGRGGLLYELALATGKRIVFYCAYGERSAMAVSAAHEAGLLNVSHIQGGVDAWRKIGAALEAGSGLK
ncbi:MAG: rhodanese-like domain-containing protein, partial [Gammaproteobacteria bacterium]|nr:rhodanese-like domain-containing protein [Gammaproteobacteria bacterium]